MERDVLGAAKAWIKAHGCDAPSIWLASPLGPIQVRLAPGQDLQQALAVLGEASDAAHVVYVQPGAPGVSILVEDVRGRRSYHRHTRGQGWVTFRPAIVQDGIAPLVVPRPSHA